MNKNQESTTAHPSTEDEAGYEAQMQEGQTLFDASDYLSAEQAFTRALEASRSRYGEHHQAVLNAYFWIGQSQMQAEKYTEAESVFRTRLPIAQSLYGESHYEVATAWHMIEIGRAHV